MRVVEIVTECEHGKSRRVLEPGEYVLVEDVHDLPRDAWRILNAAAVFGHPGGSVALWKDLRAALRGDPIPVGSRVAGPDDLLIRREDIDYEAAARLFHKQIPHVPAWNPTLDQCTCRARARGIVDAALAAAEGEEG